MTRSLRLQVAAFTATRVVLNTMHRMIYPFLLTFGRGMGVDMAALTLAVTARSLSGASGPFLAWVADKHGRKVGMIFGLGVFVAGASLVIIWPTYLAFCLALILTILGKYVFDPAMQAYLGDRVSYERRGRVLGITEISWSLAFMLGVPLMSFLITRGGWTAPFPVLAILGLAAIGVLTWLVPRDPPHPDNQNGVWRNLRSVLASAGRDGPGSEPDAEHRQRGDQPGVRGMDGILLWAEAHRPGRRFGRDRFC